MHILLKKDYLSTFDAKLYIEEILKNNYLFSIGFFGKVIFPFKYKIERVEYFENNLFKNNNTILKTTFKSKYNVNEIKILEEKYNELFFGKEIEVKDVGILKAEIIPNFDYSLYEECLDKSKMRDYFEFVSENIITNVFFYLFSYEINGEIYKNIILVENEKHLFNSSSNFFGIDFDDKYLYMDDDFCNIIKFLVNFLKNESSERGKKRLDFAKKIFLDKIPEAFI